MTTDPTVPIPTTPVVPPHSVTGMPSTSQQRAPISPVPESVPAVPSPASQALDAPDQPQPGMPSTSRPTAPTRLAGKETLVLRIEDRAAGTTNDYELVPGRELVLGADPGCDITVEDPYISARHVCVEVQPDGSVLVTDLSSRNGTFLQIKGESIDVPVGQVVLAGKTLFGIEARA